MVDFSRAEGSKNHKASFDKACNIVIDTIQQTQNMYHAEWAELEVLRKDRAAIIESTIQLLKNNKVKLTKQLGRCRNPEINEELLKVINELPFEVKEEIQCNLIKINNRYDKIAEHGKKLEELSISLSQYRIPESDYEEEVVIDMTQAKEKKASTSKNDDSKEEVIKVKKASPELIEDLDRTLDSMKKTSIDENTESDILSSIINDEDIPYANDDVLFDTDVMSTVAEEIEDITSIDSDEAIIDSYLTNFAKESEEQKIDEHILFTINDKLTLKELAQSVYGDEKFWKDLYNYGTNKGTIDRKAAEFNVSVEETASTPGYLDKITLQFPVELISLEEIPVTDEDNEYEQVVRLVA